MVELGIWVRDKTSGIGTLTYLDKNSGKFGALGHGIVDSDTELLSVDKGKIIVLNFQNRTGKKVLLENTRSILQTNNIAGDIT